MSRLILIRINRSDRTHAWCKTCYVGCSVCKKTCYGDEIKSKILPCSTCYRCTENTVSDIFVKTTVLSIYYVRDSNIIGILNIIKNPENSIDLYRTLIFNILQSNNGELFRCLRLVFKKYPYETFRYIFTTMHRDRHNNYSEVVKNMSINSLNRGNMQWYMPAEVIDYINESFATNQT